MKNLICILCAGLVLALSGCQTTSGNGVPLEQTKLFASIAVKYAVAKVIEKSPEKAERILAISKAVREVAGGEGFNTVDLLMDFVKLKANLASLSPADRQLASLLIDSVGAALKDKLGNGQLNTDRLLFVAEVAGWIEQAAAFNSLPSATVSP